MSEPGRATGAGPTSEVHAAAVALVAELPKDPLAAEIEALRKEQAELKAERKRLQLNLRNAQRKKARLGKRARQLSDNDLVAVLMMRKEQRATRAGGQGASSSEAGASCPGTESAASSSASASAPPSEPEGAPTRRELKAAVMEPDEREGSD